LRGAPAGYHPEAHRFDEQVVESIRSSSPGRIAEIDQDLRRLAGECGYRSMLVALGAAEGLDAACEVLHYEAPFGVGYLVAQLARRADAKDDRSETSSEEGDRQELSPEQDDRQGASSDEGGGGPSWPESEGEVITSLARRAVETYAREGRAVSPSEILPPTLPPALRGPAACFVSIKTEDGELRGCIGTVEPTRATLAEELVANAFSAATRDPRFPPVEASELPRLRYSVDILSGPEPAEFADLDPKVFGVIVEDEGGRRRGLLLPDIEGVESAAQQVQIASRKAGISPHEPVRLHRFRVTRFREPFGHVQTSE
jgi:AmmeMemoRadiSam system protein A